MLASKVSRSLRTGSIFDMLRKSGNGRTLLVAGDDITEVSSENVGTPFFLIGLWKGFGGVHA
jgi:hypothetical protein